MKLNKIVEEMGLKVLCSKSKLETEVNNGYSSDLLSDVIGNTNEGDIWLTIQTHKNIVAVAVMKELSCIVLVNSREADEETLKKAEEEGVVIVQTEFSAFELAGRLYALGVKGSVV